MNKIQVLDCTLRDGGYCNQWMFGYANIKKIIGSLAEANIDIVECGFLTDKITYHPDITKFASITAVTDILSKVCLPSYNCEEKIFAVMMNYGEYDIASLPDFDGTLTEGIRVAFHKKDLENALEVCRRIKEKGYKVFIQAMVSLSYSDEEFLSMIRKVNDISPYAFYIVDSFGMMKKKNLTRLFYMVEHNLNEDIWIGFHSHNNMQLAYSNAQSLVDSRTSRNLIIDSSVYGMGRGAGNLNTELLVEYINENVESRYVLKPLLNVIDEVLGKFYQSNYWGYSLPNYLAASHDAHPSYAGYLADKNSLTVGVMDEIFSGMDKEKRLEFDKEYAEELYLQYMAVGRMQNEHRNELKELFVRKRVLLIAPGSSSEKEKDKIAEYASRNEAVTISINFDYCHVKTDFIFVSNLRRFRELDKGKGEKCIVTSNIPAEQVYLQTKYYDLLNPIEAVRDNAGMMAIRFLMDLEVRSVALAGFDGYSHDDAANYASQSLTFVTKNNALDAMNEGMRSILKKYGDEINIEFVTASKLED